MENLRGDVRVNGPVLSPVFPSIGKGTARASYIHNLKPTSCLREIFSSLCRVTEGAEVLSI